MSIKVRIFHNDYPECIEEQLKKKFGDDLKIEKSDSGEMVVSIDDRGTGWRRPWLVEDIMDDLLETNEYVNKIDHIG